MPKIQFHRLPLCLILTLASLGSLSPATAETRLEDVHQRFPRTDNSDCAGRASTVMIAQSSTDQPPTSQSSTDQSRIAADATNLVATTAPAPQTTQRLNVLFIMVDDLRAQLGCYGKSFMQSPNIDALAKRGQLFERAYCMVPTCGASRASLMSGLRPHPTRFVSYTARADKDAPGFITMNQHLKNNGYTTISLGKVFHFPDDSADGWSQKPWRPKTSDYRDREAERQAIANHRKKYPKRSKVRGMPYEAFDSDDAEYRDHQIATQAIELLKQMQGKNKTKSTPFFLAVGFFKPHLPFCAPKKYWDLYDFDSIDVPSNFQSPPDAPEGAVHQSGELRSYATIPPRGSVSKLQARKLIHGYYACVSFIDAQIGRLMRTLDETGLNRNTVVILCGDHGWQLGDHGMWNKHSCFETSMHTPLIVSVPGQQPAAVPGARIAALTEFIDIYPSVCELTGITKPTHLQGTSFVPLLKNPDLTGKMKAVGRYRDGDTIRTDQYRLSEYREDKGTKQLRGRMLYDHKIDPHENVNLADRKSHQATVKNLSHQLEDTVRKTNSPTANAHDGAGEIKSSLGPN